MNSIISRLSSVLGDSDNAANIALAEELAAHPNTAAIQELVDHLSDKNRRVQSDCIKTLYEIGERRPELIARYVDEFASQLTSKNQRLQWGAMTALDAAASADPHSVHAHITQIVKASEGESVIARDHAVSILAKLCAAGHAKQCWPILFEIVKSCPVNQLPSYAETAETVVPAQEKEKLIALLTRRLKDIAEYPPKIKRVQKAIRKLEGK